jgi:aminocarboxymuconate-semialdehyde decarboxylase
MIIDFHAHIYPRPFMDEIKRRGARYGLGLEFNQAGLDMLCFEGIDFWAYVEDFYDVDRRLIVLNDAEVDLQVLSMGPPMVYWANTGLAVDLCQILNEEIADVVKRHPDRFVGLAALPLQDVGASIAELTRSVETLGFRGVQMGTNIQGKPLDHPGFWPLYEQIEQRDLPIFIHPINPLGQPDIHDYRLDLTVGFPLDTTLAAARIIFGGVMEAYPNLKFCFAHLGGALPFLEARLDLGWQMRNVFPGKKTTISRPPSDYAKSFYFDVVACTHTALHCAHMCYGADRLVLGSDAPFTIGNLKDSVECVKSFPAATEEEKIKILYENAARLLKLDL